MITVALTATVDCASGRVWRALVDPAERPLWDERVIGAIAQDQPRAPERHAWRFRWTSPPLVMSEQIQRIEPLERIATRVAIGSVRFDQLVTLHPEHDASGPRVRVGMKLVAGNRIAVIGEFLPRLEVQRLLIAYVDATLRQLRKYCESADRDPA